MSVEQIIEFDGIKFKSIPEVKGCEGCAFFDNDEYEDYCVEVPDCPDTIYHKISDSEPVTTNQETSEQSTQPTFTIDEVITVCSDYINKYYSMNVNLFNDGKFRQQLEKVSLPEYKEYVRLKNLLDL